MCSRGSGSPSGPEKPARLEAPAWFAYALPCGGKAMSRRIRSILVRPVALVLGLTAAACSSTPATETLVDGGHGGQASKADAGGSGCVPTRGGTAKGGNCTGGAASSSSAGAGGSGGSAGAGGSGGSASVGGSGGSASDASEGSGSSDAGPPTCKHPPATPPVGLLPPKGIVGTGCTAAEVAEYSQCVIARGAGAKNHCEDAFVRGATTDGGLNACGACVEATVLRPGVPTPALWGFDLLIAIQPTLGDTQHEWIYNTGPQHGVCDYASAKGNAEGEQCGIDLLNIYNCMYATCLPLCAVPAPQNGVLDEKGMTALNDCASTASTGACAAVTMKAQMDCEEYVYADAGNAANSALNECYTMYGQLQNELSGTDIFPEAGPPTAQGVAQLLELACGGGDAGF